jgi:hypothetical protein
MNKINLNICLFLFISILLANCVPTPDPYPIQNPDSVVNEAKVISTKLEAYILKWTQGLVPSQIPDNLIPDGVSDCKHFYLKNPDSATAEETWALRLAKPINQDSLVAGIPDPKITYLFLGTALAPFGSKIIVEGEYPHCRFFSMQISPPLNGKEYYAQRQFGTAEVSIADADIEPLSGNINPFVFGANRNATNRKYRMEFDLTTGNPTTLNGNAHTFPYLTKSNNRKGALIVFQGPLGYKTIAGTALPAALQGKWDLGCLWIRYYEPDNDKGSFAGVPLPKVYFVLPNGKKYFIGSDFSTLKERAAKTIKNRVTKDNIINPNFGPEVGWYKSWGITRSILNGIAQSNAWSRDSSRKINMVDLGWTGRSEYRDVPGNIEPHATTNNYATYFGRSITIPKGMVAILTGKLPTFPSTKNGESFMQSGQVRYWSIVGIDVDPFSPLPSTTIHGISDDDVIIDTNRNYIIAYSNSDDKPINATASNGVSWVNYGTQKNMGLLLRWVSVSPYWTFPLAPQENHLDWAHSDWSGSLYDSTLIGVNWRNGFMQCYLPVVHYMSKTEFEKLGNNLTAEKIPIWVNNGYIKAGATASNKGSVTVSSTINALPVNAGNNLIDGKLNSFWSSTFGQQKQIVVVDLKSIKNISAIKLVWDFLLYAKKYSLEISNDNINYTTIEIITNGNGLVDLYKNLQNKKARYVKLNCTKYNAGYYRLAEFEVYTNDCNCNADAPDVFKPSINSKGKR